MILNTQSFPTDLKMLRKLIHKLYLTLIFSTSMSFCSIVIVLICTILKILTNSILPIPMEIYKDIALSTVFIIFILRSPYIKILSILKEIRVQFNNDFEKKKSYEIIDTMEFKMKLMRCTIGVNEAVSSAIISIILLIIFILINK